MRTKSIQSIPGAIATVLALLAMLGGQDQQVWAQAPPPNEWETVAPPPPTNLGWRWNVWKPQGVDEVHVHPQRSDIDVVPIPNAFRRLLQRCVGMSPARPTMRYYSLFTPGRPLTGLLSWLMPQGPGLWEFLAAERTNNPAPNWINHITKHYGDIVVTWAKPAETENPLAKWTFIQLVDANAVIAGVHQPKGPGPAFGPWRVDAYSLDIDNKVAEYPSQFRIDPNDPSKGIIKIDTPGVIDAPPLLPLPVGVTAVHQEFHTWLYGLGVPLMWPLPPFRYLAGAFSWGSIRVLRKRPDGSLDPNPNFNYLLVKQVRWWPYRSYYHVYVPWYRRILGADWWNKDIRGRSLYLPWPE